MGSYEGEEEEGLTEESEWGTRKTHEWTNNQKRAERGGNPAGLGKL